MGRSHVLLVSDDSDARELYTDWFARTADLRTTCTPAFDHVDALLDLARPDVVLVDLAHVGQWQACASLGQRADAPPLVVLTGWIAADGRFRKRAFDAGCAAFIGKPCHPRVLVTVLRRVLDGERHIAMA